MIWSCALLSGILCRLHGGERIWVRCNTGGRHKSIKHVRGKSGLRRAEDPLEKAGGLERCQTMESATEKDSLIGSCQSSDGERVGQEPTGKVETPCAGQTLLGARSNRGLTGCSSGAMKVAKIPG